MSVREYIGARYVPLFAEPLAWDSTKNYEPLTIVLYQGNSFTSRQYVPAGIEITNEDFWALTGNYNAQVEAYRMEVAALTSELADVESGYVKGYNTVADMKVDVDYLTPGLICHTNGFHTSGDGGAAWYVISSTGTANGMDVIECGELFATLTIDGVITPEMVGAYGDGLHDDTNSIVRAIELGDTVNFKPVTYIFKTIYVEDMSNKTINGNGAKLKSTLTNSEASAESRQYFTNSNTLSSTDTSFKNGFITIRDLSIECSSDTFANIDTSNWFNGILLRNFESVTITGCSVSKTLNAGIKLLFCNKSVVDGCEFKDICLYNYSRSSYVGEGVVSLGYFYVNGSQSNVVRRMIDSMVVRNCVFDNIRDTPAVAINCRMQDVYDNIMNNIVGRVFECNHDSSDWSVKQVARFHGNTVNGIGSTIVSAQGTWKAGMSWLVDVRENVFSEIRGILGLESSPRQLFIASPANWSGNAGETGIEFNICDNSFNYADSSVYSSIPSQDCNINAVGHARFERNIFNGIHDRSSTWLYSSAKNALFTIKDNIFNGNTTTAHRFFDIASNNVELVGNSFNLTSDSLHDAAQNGVLRVSQTLNNTESGRVIVCDNYLSPGIFTNLVTFLNGVGIARLCNNTIATTVTRLAGYWGISGGSNAFGIFVSIGNIASQRLAGSSVTTTTSIDANNSYNS